MNDLSHIREARKTQAQYWDSNLDPNNQSGSYDNKTDYESELPFYMCPDQKVAINLALPCKDKLLLEIGSGVGMNARWFHRCGAVVVAIDLARERLTMLRQLVAGDDHAAGTSLPFLCVRAKVEALPFRADRFDIEYVKAVLIHTELEESAAEMNRVLKPDGKALIVEPMDANPIVNIYRNTLAPKIWKNITIYFSPKQIQTLYNKLNVTYEKRFYLLSFLAFIFQFGIRVPFLFNLTHAILGPIDRFLFKCFPVLKRYAWFVLICGGKKEPNQQI